MVVRLKLLLAVALLSSACATTKPAAPFSLERELAQPPFDRAFWAVHVEEDDGRVLLSLNADKLVIPASNRKLFASATVATCLGLDAQLHTAIFRDGEDLVIRGDGDPSLGSWRYERDGDFDRLAETLRARGITRVRDVVVDVSAFDRNTIPGGWKFGNLGSDYSAPVDAIAWGENELPGDRATPDPASYAGNVLRDALTLHGIAVEGVRVNSEPHAWEEPIADLPSPFIGQLLQTVLKNSHNLYAEMLLKRSADGTYDAAFARERAFLTSDVHLDGNTFRFVDGSGLAPDDLMTARTAVSMLRWMNDPSRRAYWWATLSTPNQDGTLRRRLVALESRVRAKTGTINGVAALSGIVAMPNGHFRYFSIVVNHHIGDGSDAVKIIDTLVERIADGFLREGTFTTEA
ncbi:MAG: D-alanyl-D-alanine carboxypeptidase, partial [Acidobacteriota bacterium]